MPAAFCLCRPALSTASSSSLYPWRCRCWVMPCKRFPCQVSWDMYCLWSNSGWITAATGRTTPWRSLDG
ncbi:MAG: hypothetical protein D9N14_05495 [Ketobacter sp.]|nr:MAG: hypothetical protein D9N14_05495 [Ketobacter sp.]